MADDKPDNRPDGAPTRQDSDGLADLFATELGRDYRRHIARRLGRFAPWLAGALGIVCLLVSGFATVRLMNDDLSGEGIFGFVALVALTLWLFVEALIVLRRALR
jgi:hypothetical protein